VNQFARIFLALHEAVVARAQVGVVQVGEGIAEEIT
jgi:hypothetical protein